MTLIIKLSSLHFSNYLDALTTFYTYFGNINNFAYMYFFVLSSQSMELIGGNEIKLPRLKKENMTYVFPNKVSLYGVLTLFLLKISFVCI